MHSVVLAQGSENLVKLLTISHFSDIPDVTSQN